MAGQCHAIHAHICADPATELVCVCVALAPQADTMAALSKERMADTNATLLAECVTMRHAVYKKLASHDVASKAVRRAVYRYYPVYLSKAAGPRSLGLFCSQGSRQRAALAGGLWLPVPAMWETNCCQLWLHCPAGGVVFVALCPCLSINSCFPTLWFLVCGPHAGMWHVSLRAMLPAERRLVAGPRPLAVKTALLAPSPPRTRSCCTSKCAPGSDLR